MTVELMIALRLLRQRDDLQRLVLLQSARIRAVMPHQQREHRQIPGATDQHRQRLRPRHLGLLLRPRQPAHQSHEQRLRADVGLRLRLRRQRDLTVPFPFVGAVASGIGLFTLVPWQVRSARFAAARPWLARRHGAGDDDGAIDASGGLLPAQPGTARSRTPAHHPRRWHEPRSQYRANVDSYVTSTRGISIRRACCVAWL
jgi:hypothetical protein